MNGIVMLSSIGLALSGFLIAYLMYVAGSIKWNQSITESKSPLVRGLYQFSFNKWYFDNLYMGILREGHFACIPGNLEAGGFCSS